MPRSLTFYAPTFIDESLTRPDARGRQAPTGRLNGMVFTRTFSKTRTGKIRGQRGIVAFSWEEDTDDAKVAALSRAISGMEEMSELDTNPPVQWVPSVIKERLQ